MSIADLEGQCGISLQQHGKAVSTHVELGAQDGCSILSGCLRCDGYRIRSYQFDLSQRRKWLQEIPGARLQICLNVTGHGEIQAGTTSVFLEPESVALYKSEAQPLKNSRSAGEKHHFVVIDLSPCAWKRFLVASGIDTSRLGDLVKCKARCQNMSLSAFPLTSELRLLAFNLCSPPVSPDGRRLWYQAKLFEIVATVLFCPRDRVKCPGNRQKLLNRERVFRVKSLLRENFMEPLSLEEIARRVGCSQYYLSRIFSSETGQTISAYLQNLKLERAATLLQEGRLNVTEVAMDVGYSSLSHFSQVFRARYGCCPVLFPTAVSKIA